MFSVLIKLNWFFKKQWKQYAVAFILLLLASVLEVIPPMIVGRAIDDIFFGMLSPEKFFYYIGVLIIGAIFNYIFTYKWQYHLFGGSFVLERMMRSRMMRHFLKMSPIFYEKNRTGDLMARATNDLTAISTTAGYGILTLLDSTLYMMTILITMSVLVSWKLTLAAIIPLPLLAYGTKILGDQIHKKFIEAQDAFGDMNDRVLESVEGIRVVRAYNRERYEEKEFAKMTQDVFQKNMLVEKIDAFFFPLTRILTGASFCIGLSYGTYLVFHQEITLGELVAFNVYLGMLTWPMFAIGELINVMQRGNASLDRVQEILDYKEEISDPKNPIRLDELSSITFHDLSFQYPSSSSNNLEHISLKIQEGQTIGIVGKTGSGKTTLIKQILREYPLGKGDLLFSDVSIKKQTKKDIRQRIGYVPQEPFLFSKTIKENILFGNSDATEEELKRAIMLADFDKDLARMPDGLDTLVGEKGVGLSGGQKQRISIARALIKDPELLILDDALSAVDAKTEAKIIQNIKENRKGKTTLISTHRLSAVEHAHWIIVLEDGKVVEEGTHADLIRKNGWYKEQYERQKVTEALQQEVTT